MRRIIQLTFFVSQLGIVDASNLLANGFRSRATFINHDSILSVRGGASESASAWSAGSKYDYGPSRPTYSSSSSPTRYSTSQSQDEKEETKEAFAEAFLQRNDRNRFIARVYAILTGQLLFTAGTIHAFHLNPSIRDWMLLHPAGRKVPLLGLLISTIAWWITLSSESIRQSSNLRWPLLIAFTVGESIEVGSISSIYAYSSVIKAVIATATTTLSVTLYTILQKNPKYDLSQWGRALVGLGMAFLLYGMIHVLELFGVLPPGFLPYSEATYSIIGCIQFCKRIQSTIFHNGGGR
eukprot:CAMPEP_0183747988 /NCGR_PEP_ID=MMETSP0737-20130205/67541_1 /TAXON_ID=385413 /ORGANISM="Thalassiosira miniscula, Strain CCMP1093" /LENGTH=294 /DNA_ID=CAMNT_0025983705 /DNA_START=249 /DNA_END=1136 /DNA_ORIENTATION=-